MIGVGDIVRVNARHLGDREALVTLAERITHREFNHRVNRIAAGLTGFGVRAGDRVAVLSRNHPDYVATYFALAKLGAALVPLNFWHRATEHRFVLDDAAPRVVIVEDEFGDVIRSASEGRTGTRLVEVPAGYSDGRSDPPWEAVYGPPDSPEPLSVTDLDLPHMVLYTSGTTGRPKGAVLSQRRTVEDAYSMALALRIGSNDTFIEYHPPFHVGNWDHLKLYFLVGARTVLLREFEPSAVLDAVERERVSVMLAGSTMLKRLVEHPTFATRDYSGLRLLYGGNYDPSGAPAKAIADLGARDGKVAVAATYGLTEAGPFVTLCPPEEALDRVGTIGRPIPGVEITLLGDDGNPVVRGTPGELCVAGPHLSEYLGLPDVTAETLAGGLLHTGDIAVEDEEGYFWLVDRLKDMVRSGGHNVYSKVVENCLVEHPSVRDAAVVAVPDPEFGEAVCAVVVPADLHDDGLADDLRDWVRGRIAGYNVPKHVFLTDELPKSAIGKTLKRRLREEYGSRVQQLIASGAAT
ncbi:AMP-binding protein [Pseudonocardia sp. RS11V-5]|uniref:class I adenylate-forming enzyme family protein n=1 Tax=Pseudonocardia terrae TaxID=2905831 RepID=UPI001E46F3E6|nr:AMP-binding protein [Pseudonocardia terrae]MCE3550876.1 AMP-binding protein [Pseudonocardia terrae]